MKYGERRDLIRHRLACITPSKQDVEERLACLEAQQIAMAEANRVRRLANFEVFAKAHPPGSLKRPPRPATEEGREAPGAC